MSLAYMYMYVAIYIRILQSLINRSVCRNLAIYKNLLIFKPGMCGHRPCTSAFLKYFLFMCWYVCVCVSVCPLQRALINSGVIWCDIGCV